jgi:hypothetical protein
LFQRPQITIQQRLLFSKQFFAGILLVKKYAKQPKNAIFAPKMTNLPKKWYIHLTSC